MSIDVPEGIGRRAPNASQKINCSADNAISLPADLGIWRYSDNGCCRYRRIANWLKSSLFSAADNGFCR